MYLNKLDSYLSFLISVKLIYNNVLQMKTLAKAESAIHLINTLLKAPYSSLKSMSLNISAISKVKPGKTEDVIMSPGVIILEA